MNVKVFASEKRFVQDLRRTQAVLADHGWEHKRTDGLCSCTIEAWHPDNTNWTMLVLYAVDPEYRWARRIEIKWWQWDCPDDDGNPTIYRRCIPIGDDRRVPLYDVLPMTGDDVTFQALWAACDGLKAA